MAMQNEELLKYWIESHNEKYYKYILSNEEPRYQLKTFFLNSFYLFKELAEGWEEYLATYEKLFRRDPSSDYYKYRDPIVDNSDQRRKNALEWATLFEIIAQVGYPHNNSAKRNLLDYANKFLSKGIENPASQWFDFMITSVVANLPNDFPSFKEDLPSLISTYIQNECTPHQYMAYLYALRRYDSHSDLKSKLIAELLEWIDNPTGNYRSQILIWARLITRMDWLSEINVASVQATLRRNFLRTIDEIYSVDWSNSPMILQALWRCIEEDEQDIILEEMRKEITPSSFLKFREIFPFIHMGDEAMDVESEVISLNEKCSIYPSLADCSNCRDNKKDDCWIRVLSKVKHMQPRLHSGYEVADVVIYDLAQGIYVILKAEPITTSKGGGDNLFRQCVSLFSNDHALVLYLNPHETAPFIIERIRKAASSNSNNPRFEVVDKKYIRQIYKRYLEIESLS